MNSKELVKQEDTTVFADDELIAVADAAEKRVAAIKKIVTMALKVTSENDWIDQNGKPYLQGNGAEAVANLFGVSWRFIDKPQRVDEGDGHFRYECTLEVSFRSRTVEVVGARSTKDAFFSTRYKWNDETKKREAYQLLPSEIDSADIMKSTITNAIGNGVTRILGIRNATWDMLKEAGLNIEKIQKVEYQKTEEAPEIKNLREEIRRMILEMSEENEDEAKRMLEKLTSFVPKGKTEADRVRGKLHVKDLTEKQIALTYGKVKEACEQWQQKQWQKEKIQPFPEPDPINKMVSDFLVLLQHASTPDELHNIFQKVINADIQGEDFTMLMKERDKRAVTMKGGL